MVSLLFAKIDFFQSNALYERVGTNIKNSILSYGGKFKIFHFHVTSFVDISARMSIHLPFFHLPTNRAQRDAASS